MFEEQDNLEMFLASASELVGADLLNDNEDYESAFVTKEDRAPVVEILKLLWQWDQELKHKTQRREDL